MNLAEEVKIKTFPVRMSLKLNKLLREVAEKEGVTAHQYVLNAICERIAKDEKAV